MTLASWHGRSAVLTTSAEIWKGYYDDDEPGVYGMDVTIGGEHDHVAVQPYKGINFLACIHWQPFYAWVDGVSYRHAAKRLTDSLRVEAKRLRYLADDLDRVAGEIAGAVGGLP